jgi:hypothetical protein
LYFPESLSDLETHRKGWKHLTIADRLELLDVSHQASIMPFVAKDGLEYTSKDCTLRLIKGVDSTNILLKLYDTAKANTGDPRTLEMLWISRELLFVCHRPKVAACLEALKEASDSSLSQNVPSLPTDIFEIIVEFALPLSTNA